MLATLLVAATGIACTEVPRGAKHDVGPTGADPQRPVLETSDGRHAGTGLVDDTLRTPAIVEPGAHQIIDQMIADYESYADEYRDLTRRGEDDDKVFIKADSLLRHAENVYAGLVDAMEINTFSAGQRRRLDNAKSRFDRLAKSFHATTRPKRVTTPRH